jgi:cob(I)alamin adenosyltransferase
MDQRGYVHIYTGDGKGKTTAAIGLAVRALGAGWKVGWFQFLKGRPTSEHAVLRRLPGFSLFRYGRPTWVRGKPGPRDLARARAGLKALGSALATGRFDLVVADELCTALQVGVLSEAEVQAVLRRRVRTVELVLTGRGATRGLLRTADLVTEMRARRHYFTRGVRARRGIER